MDRVGNGLANYTHGSRQSNKEARNGYRERFTCVPNCNSENGGPPYFTVIIAVLCTIAYFVYNFNQPGQTALLKSIWILDGTQNWAQPWRFFTYSFLHADAMHLISNMIIFLLVTPMLELGHDSIRPAVVYVVGCVLGGLLSGIVAPGVYLVGASGGCYALVLAHIANIIVNGDIMDKKALVLRLVVLTPMVGACLFDAYLAVQRWTDKNAMGSGGGVSYAAHVAGGFTGIFLGAFVLRNYENAKWEGVLKLVFMGIYAVAFIAVAVLSIMHIDINTFDNDDTFEKSN